MPDSVSKHLNWIAQYCAVASGDNWRDILNRIEHQIALAQRDARNVK